MAEDSKAKVEHNPKILSGPVLINSPNAALSKSLLSRYQNIELFSKDDTRLIATYVWIDGTGEHIRCKDRTLSFYPRAPSELPVWNFDGSSTGQADRKNADTHLVPRTIYKDPFRRGPHILVMCDTYKYNMAPTVTNHRVNCQAAYDKCTTEEPWFGIEQEYILLDAELRPFGWPPGDCPPPQGPYYCGVGANKVFARDLVQAHYLCCLYAGIPLAGTNAEAMPSQWEFQVGPAVGVKAADDLWMARFILHRLAEEFGIIVSFDPKPVENWNGSGAHVNFSTKAMRAKNGIVEIEKAIEKLSKVHMKHIQVYDPRGGKDNERRLTGLHETASINNFTSGVANRSCSIRIPRKCAEESCGYLEDRRPASNCDPYAVIDALLRTCILNESE
ncbi:glutamine synthetase 2 cytoplasmic-like [Pieris rapae]|uniref:glutamine synthetase 2 cytoplasmic-like n=1 Tax=Pieris rapae TaxID=64459 RepID=UPI001E27F47B|nr:glutamine synthetase 2 cytoplasmic-like [Pieris rapae]